MSNRTNIRDYCRIKGEPLPWEAEARYLRSVATTYRQRAIRAHDSGRFEEALKYTDMAHWYADKAREVAGE